MKEQVINILRPLNSGIFIDATFGNGGHSFAIMEKKGLVLGLDKDPIILKNLKNRQEDLEEEIDQKTKNIAFEDVIPKQNKVNTNLDSIKLKKEPDPLKDEDRTSTEKKKILNDDETKNNLLGLKKTLTKENEDSLNKKTDYVDYDSIESLATKFNKEENFSFSIKKTDRDTEEEKMPNLHINKEKFPFISETKMLNEKTNLPKKVTYDYFEKEKTDLLSKKIENSEKKYFLQSETENEKNKVQYNKNQNFGQKENQAENEEIIQNIDQIFKFKFSKLQKSSKTTPSLFFKQITFSEMFDVWAKSISPARPNGILFDLGVSSMQLDNAEAGFSFMKDGPLDMRFSKHGQTASEWLEKASEKEMEEVFKIYGEEKNSAKIAKAIVVARKEGKLTKTKQLCEIIAKINYKKEKKHPATRVFQAIRIKINNEFEELKKALEVAYNLLRPTGRLVVISFHSLEDKIVKDFFASKKWLCSNLEFPSYEEIKRNPRARSAKLRWGEK